MAIESFISSPATRTDSLNTVPPKLNTATSVVPPPMSTIIVPIGSVTGNDALLRLQQVHQLRTS